MIAQRYLLSERVGRGGMGEVWRAVDQVLGRAVAVKMMPTAPPSTSAADRFRLEATAAGRISDPHVVAVYDFGADQDHLFLVMELIEGNSLADTLTRCGPLPPARVSDLIRQAGRGLASAHRHGVVHRGIKPGNLLLQTAETKANGIDRCTLKIADFGIARITDDPELALTATGEIAGTSPYLAPERALGQAGGPPADIYSLGCVGYHLVIGAPPFHGGVPAAIAFQHVHGRPVPPRELRPEVPAPLEDLLLRMLAKNPEDRPTAREVADWMDQTPAPARIQPVAIRPASPTGLSFTTIDGHQITVYSTDGRAVPSSLAGMSTSPGERQPLPPTTSPAKRRGSKRAGLSAATTAAAIGAAVLWIPLHTGAQTETSPPGTTMWQEPAQTNQTAPVRPTSPPTTRPTEQARRSAVAAAGRNTTTDSAVPRGADNRDDNGSRHARNHKHSKTNQNEDG